MTSPALFINDVIETKPRRAGDTFVRFVVNSTAGIGGLFDVASSLGYPYHDSDFGTTLALWGVPEGPFLFLPVLGPSNPRDAAGFGVDVAFDPLTLRPVRTRAAHARHRPARADRGGHALAPAGGDLVHQEDRAGPIRHVPQPLPPEPRKHH